MNRIPVKPLSWKKILLGASVWVMAASLPASAGASVLNSFSTATEALRWTFNNGGEFPGARGEFVITSGADGANQYGELRYDFTPPSPLPSNFNPRYVQAIRSLTAEETSAPHSRIRFRYQKSRPEVRLNVRWTDASGQTLQKPVYSRQSLEQTMESLQDVTVDIGSAPTYWGGSNNGVTRFPIRSLSFICDAAGLRDTGWIRLDEVRLLPSSEEAVIAFNTSVELTDWRFGNGGEFPGARGGITHEVANGNGYARVNYDFTLPANWVGSFCPTYVEAWRTVPSAASGVRFRLALSTTDAAVRLRYVDSSGQTFQSELIKRGAGPAGGVWTEVSQSFVPVATRWGGSGDGVVHFPIKRVSVILDAAGHRDTGYLKIDDFVIVNEPVPTVKLGAGSLVPPRWETGALADHAGVSVHFTVDDKAMDAVYKAGFRWIRKDAFWDQVERTAGRYDFSTIDSLVNSAESRGITTVLILSYGNPIYTGGVAAPPRTTTAIAGYENYCAAIAARYSGRKVMFEIWNEPDVPAFWGGSPNATEYAKMLERGILGLRRGNPNAKTITGGLSSVYSTTFKFYDVLVASGAMAGADGVGVHLYGCAYPEAQWNNVLALKSMAAGANGGNLWCSEWGFSSTDLSPARNGHEAIGRHIQANMAVRQLFFGWWANLPLVALYNVRDGGIDPYHPEDNYGLLARDYSEKPAMKAVGKLLSTSRGRTLAGLLRPAELPTGMHVARLDGAVDFVYMVWVDEGTPDALLAISDLRAVAVDLYGNRVSLVRSGADLTIPITTGRGPIYITVPRS